MPPLSVLSAPPPPPPGGAPEPPAAPGAIPRLSLATPHEKPAAPKDGGLHIKVAAEPPLKVGGKPPVKPSKLETILQKRPALGPVAKAGIAVVVVAVAIGGVFSYRIFFPGPSREVRIKAPPIAKPSPTDIKNERKNLLNKAATEPGKLIDSGQNAIAARRQAEQAKIDAALAGLEAPTPTPEASVVIMVPTSLTSDVKVNNTRIDSAPAASPAFRSFVASASIGGVFQGAPSRALINGSIVREGQVIENSLGITFDRIDAVKKVIYFKDSTGAEVSKNY